jgi:uncharacterized YigZ family protein
VILINTIQKPVSFEQIINKSRFIAYLYPVDNVEEAMAILGQIRKKHYDATHNCYSYIIGIDNLTAKSSDDGEPSQTAGVVIFEVLKKNNLTNVLAIVTRYFGGIKLGAGGLIRAYGSSVSEALKIAEILKIEKLLTAEIITDYSYINIIQRLLENYEIIERNFAVKALLKIRMPEAEFKNLKEALIEVSKGNVEITVLKTEMAPTSEIETKN